MPALHALMVAHAQTQLGVSAALVIQRRLETPVLSPFPLAGLTAQLWMCRCLAKIMQLRKNVVCVLQ